jgi:hypothetical protein
MYNHFLRILKNTLGIVCIAYFFLPVIVRFFVVKITPSKSPSIIVQFLSCPIFKPILQQYDIALAKNNPLYYLAFLVGLLLVCWACWLIIYYVIKLVYLAVKR